MTIADTIRDQIGNQTLFMLGAKNLLNHGDALSFRIRGCRKINYIKITLTAADLYDVEFGKVRGIDYKVVSTTEGAYADQLHRLIETETGLATKL